MSKSSIIDERNQLKKRFCEEFFKLARVKGANSGFMNYEQYKTTIESVKLAKSVKKKTPKQYRRLKRFDIRSIGGVEKLITPVPPQCVNFKYYVPNEDVFDLIHDTHLSIGHGGRTRMIQKLHRKYKNITQEIVAIYLSLCTSCQMKVKGMKKGLVGKPISHSETNSRCQIDLIDMQANPDGPYKFILVYQDDLTKFVQLTPLKTKTVAEVAPKVLDIFCTFGAPMNVQSNNGPEFSNNLLEELTSMWPGLKLISGKPPQGSYESLHEDVKKNLVNCLQDNKTKNWSKGLKFVQIMKNSAYHDGIKEAPYKAMFGIDLKAGLLDSKLPQELITDFSTEEGLLDVIKEISMQETLKLSKDAESATSNDDPYSKCASSQSFDGTAEMLHEQNASSLYGYSIPINDENKMIQVDDDQKALCEVGIMYDKQIETKNALERSKNNTCKNCQQLIGQY